MNRRSADPMVRKSPGYGLPVLASPRIRALPLRLPGRDGAVVWVPMAVALACGLWAVAVPSPWTDELVTMDVAQRSLPQLWALVHHTDAVHGVYYLLVHAVVRIFGVSPLTVRLWDTGSRARWAGRRWSTRGRWWPSAGGC